MSSNNIKVVVARYKEDLSWLADVKEHCVVYDKGQDGDACVASFPDVRRMDNWGREASSYLAYIVATYPRFPEYVLFTQGSVKDHVVDMPVMLALIKALAEGRPSPIGPRGRYTDINHQWGQVRQWRDYNHPGIPIKEAFEMLYDSFPVDGTFKCNYCGIFMVSREALLSHSKKFYELMLNWMPGQPWAAHVYERLWAIIFASALKGKREVEHGTGDVS
jgi:hypothetical protein